MGSENEQPSPQRLYVHDDITEEVAAEYGVDSEAHRLALRLLAIVARDTARVTVLTLQQQINALIERESHEPFEVALGIGEAGERVARQVHERTGWFPEVRRVDITRVEDGHGGYVLEGTAGRSWEDRVRGLAIVKSLAVVDDTVFSGLTMRSVLRALPSAQLSVTKAFCLRGVAESIGTIRDIVPTAAGVSAPGRILDEVSFINASGLVRSIAIRRRGRPPQAFFERPQWIGAWFPEHADEVIEVCRNLNRLLERRGTR